MAPYDYTPVPSAIGSNTVVAPLTWGQLIEVIKGDQTLSSRKRQEWASSIRSFGRALDLDLANGLAAVQPYRRYLREFLPAGVGMSAKTWSNVRSAVLGALRRYCGPVKRTNLPRNLSPAWLECRKLLKSKGTEQLVRGLSAFIHFCNQAGVEPEQVNNEVAALFLEYKCTATTCRNPEDKFRETCGLWNKAATLPGWPVIRLTLPCYRKRISIEWSALPPAFVVDLNLWCANAGKRPLGFEDAGARSLAPTTIATRRAQMHRLASVMLKAGMPECELQSLRDLCRIDYLRAGLELYAAHLGTKEAPSLSETMAGVIALAKTDLALPANTIAALKKLKRLTGSRARTMTEKNYERLRPLRDPHTLQRLITLGPTLASQVGRINHPTRRAIAFQTALLITFLILVPLRIGNLQHLRLEEHLRWVNHGRRSRLFLVILGTETKNRVRIEVELPPLLRRMIEAYRDHYRRELTNSDSAWLFPGAKDSARPKSQVMLRDQIVNAIRKHVGIHFHPHLARHLAAYLWLRNNPGDYGTVARVLGHKAPDTAFQFYAGLEQIETAIRYNETILKSIDRKGA